MIFRVLIRLVEFLAVLLFARIVLRGLVGLFASGPPRVDPAAPGPRTIEAQEMVRDTVCNTFIPRQAAVVARLSGADAYFCSEACRDKAVAALRKAS